MQIAQKIVTRVVTSLSGFVLCIGSGCGPSPSEVLDEFRPAYDAKREALPEIVETLPPTGTVSSRSGDRSPLQMFL